MLLFYAKLGLMRLDPEMSICQLASGSMNIDREATHQRLV